MVVLLVVVVFDRAVVGAGAGTGIHVVDVISEGGTNRATILAAAWVVRADSDTVPNSAITVSASCPETAADGAFVVLVVLVVLLMADFPHRQQIECFRQIFIHSSTL